MSDSPAPPISPSATPPTSSAEALHRSGAVARMLRMPVATLRVWERRYALTQPELSPSGQRLYSADDVRRLALLKQLTDLGHAIGSLAALDMAQLRQVAATHAQALATRQVQSVAESGPTAEQHSCRVAVVGAALFRRLQRPALLRRLGHGMEVLGPFDDGQHVATALAGALPDALLVHEPQLQSGWLADWQASASALAEKPHFVLYSFAAESVCEELASAGVSLLREPQPDAVLAQWLQGLAVRKTRPGWALAEPMAVPHVPPPRWDGAALADFAALSSTIACECPRHVAELLVQLSHFEAYSAQCEDRSPADAGLHAYLRRVTAASRASFEAALEHVAQHEGLTLPATRKAAAAKIA